MISDAKKRDQVETEKNILQLVKHKLIVKIHHYFETQSHHHFVIDFCPGGELFFHLRKQSRFKEQIAKTVFV